MSEDPRPAPSDDGVLGFAMECLVCGTAMRLGLSRKQPDGVFHGIGYCECCHTVTEVRSGEADDEHE